MGIDLAGALDSDDKFTSIDEATEQHLRETAERAVRTRRGTINETEELANAYIDLAEELHSKGPFPLSAYTSAVQEGLELDARIQSARVTFDEATPEQRIPFDIELRLPDGTVIDVQG